MGITIIEGIEWEFFNIQNNPHTFARTTYNNKFFNVELPLKGESIFDGEEFLTHLVNSGIFVNNESDNLLNKFKITKNPFQLGDAISTALSSVGITEDRVSKWLGRPCGCAKRRKKLNELSDWAIMVATNTAKNPKEAIEKILSKNRK